MDHIHKFDFTDIGDGIKTTVAWFMANFEKARK
jgi:hypothetical protein